MTAPPPSKEVEEFQFKLQCRLRVFPKEQSIQTKKPRKLLSSSSKYGLTFIGCPNGVQCINVANIITANENQKNRKYILDYPRRELSLGETPTHLDISCDNELLAVAFCIQNCPVLYVYSVTSFSSKDIAKKYEVRLSNTPGVEVLDFQWNPRLQNILGAVLSDGSVVACDFKDGSFSLSTLPGSVQATCLCWSPKGKQLVIGAANGTLSQYKPELKLVKSFQPPQLTNNPVAVVSVQWLSSFQFAAVYKDVSDSSHRPVLMIVNVPKGVPVSYINYDELCYGSWSERPEHFFIHQQEWNLLIVGSGNSMELGVLKQQGETPGWEQWSQGEANRAELPLTEDHSDVYTVGLAFDTTVNNKIPMGGDKVIGPMPIVHMLSHEGVLCMFYAINLLPNVPNVCSPPQPLPDQSGINLFSVPQGKVSTTTSAVTTSASTTQENVATPKTTAPTTQPMTNLFSSVFTGGSVAPTTQTGFFSNTQPLFSSPQAATSSGSLFAGSLSFQTPAQPTTQQQNGLLQTPPAVAKPVQTSTPVVVPTFQVPAVATTVAQKTLTHPEGGSFLGPLSQQQATSSPLQQPAPAVSQPTFNFGPGGAQQSFQLQQRLPASPQQKPALLQQPPVQQLPGQQQQMANSQQPQVSNSQQQQTVSSTPQQQTKPISQNPPPPPAGPQMTKQPLFPPSQSQNTAPPTHPILFQAKQSKTDQQQQAARQKAPPSPMVASPQPPTPTPAAMAPIRPPVDALQRTMVPQQYYPFGQAKGGSELSGQPVILRKQDAVKATKITPITISAKNLSLSGCKISQGKSEETLADNNVSAKIKDALTSQKFEQKCRAAIQTEIKKFAADLKILERIISNVNIKIGDEEQKNELKIQTENLEAFGKDLRETTATQEAEVSVLRENLMETYSWCENINAKHRLLTDSKYFAMKESDELDPISRQHIKSIEKNLLFLESSVKVIIADLETMWTQKKEDCRRRAGLKTPALETIFQSIMTIYKLINKQKMVITDLENNVPLKVKKKMNHPDFKITKEKKQHIPGNTELSKLAEKLLSTKLVDRDDMNSSFDSENKYSAPPSSKYLTPEQENKLLQWHKNCKGIRTVVLKKRIVTNDMLNSTMEEPLKSMLSQSNVKLNELDQENGDILFTKSPSAKSSLPGAVINSIANAPSEVYSTTPKVPLPTKGIFSLGSQNKLIVNANEDISNGVPPTEGLGSLFSDLNHSLISPDKQISQNSEIGVKSTQNNKVDFSVKFGEGTITSTTPLKLFGVSVPALSTQNNIASNKPLSSLSNISIKKDDHESLNDSGSVKPLSGEGDTVSKLAPTSANALSFGNIEFSKQPQIGSSSKTPFTFPSSQSTPSTNAGNSFTLSDFTVALATPPPTANANQTNEPSSVSKDPSDKPSSGFNFSFPSINTSKLVTKPSLKTPELTGVAQQAETKSGTSSTFSTGGLVATSPNQKGNAPVSQPSSSIFSNIPTTSMFRSALVTSTFSFTIKTSENSSNPVTEVSAVTPLKSETSAPCEESSSKSTAPAALTGETPSLSTSSTAQPELSKPSIPAFSSLAISSSSNNQTSSSGSFFGSQSSFVSQPKALLPTPATTTPAASPSSFAFGTQAPVFASTPLFGSAPTAVTTSSIFATSSSTPVFAISTPSTTSQLSFNTTAAATTTTASQPIFESTPAPVVTVNSSQPTSDSSATTTSAPIFGGATTVQTTSQSDSVSAASTSPTTSSQQSAFVSTPTTTTLSVFSSPAPAVTTTSQSIFGSTPTVAAAPSSSIFGSTPAVTTTSQSIFGSAPPTTTSSIFGTSTPTVTTSSQSIFGNTPTTTTSSVFGSTTTAPESIFGGVAPAFAATSKSSFGASTSSVNFGSVAATTTAAPIFGLNMPFASTTTTSSTFGTSAEFSTPATKSSIFGTPTSSSTFGGAPVFGTPSTSGGGTFFGQAICSPTSTAASSVFGAQPAATKSFFGQTTPSSATATSLNFGSAVSSPAFGQQQGGVVNPFGQTSNAGNFGSSGGSMFRSLGFGSQNQQQGNLFQSPGGSNIFGSPASPVTSGSFSSGQSVSQTGFGSPPSFQNKSPAFGASGSSVFGSQPTFGSPPAFGGSATFGSPNKVFGSTSPSVGFGSLAQPTQSSTFETLATQNTMTFGNLAQSQPAAGFFAQPPTTQSGFGGSSFNTWR